MEEFYHQDQIHVSTSIDIEKSSFEDFILEGNSSIIIECEYCRQRCVEQDYNYHRVGFFFD